MNKSNEIIELNDEINCTLETLNEQVRVYQKKIKKECSNIIIKEKHKLLQKVSEIYKIDLDDLKNKCLKTKELQTTEINLNVVSNDSDELLDKIEIDGIKYYYENKENGKIFNSEYNNVGMIKNNTFIIKNN